MARFPYMKVRVASDRIHRLKAEGDHRGERYGLPMRDPIRGLDRPAMFAGGVDSVIHPGDELHVVPVTGSFLDGSAPSAMTAQTWFGADGIAVSERAIEVNGQQILAACRK